MTDYAAELAYFRIALGQTFAAELIAGLPLPEKSIRDTVESGPFNLEKSSREYIIRELEHSFTTTQKRGAAVKSDYIPWLSKRRANINFFFSFP